MSVDWLSEGKHMVAIVFPASSIRQCNRLPLLIEYQMRPLPLAQRDKASVCELDKVAVCIVWRKLPADSIGAPAVSTRRAAAALLHVRVEERVVRARVGGICGGNPLVPILDVRRRERREQVV